WRDGARRDDCAGAGEQPAPRRGAGGVRISDRPAEDRRDVVEARVVCRWAGGAGRGTRGRSASRGGVGVECQVTAGGRFWGGGRGLGSVLSPHSRHPGLDPGSILPASWEWTPDQVGDYPLATSKAICYIIGHEQSTDPSPVS